MAKTPQFSLADQLFNRQTLKLLSDGFAQAWSGFDGKKFERSVLPRLQPLTLKERIRLIAEALDDVLPSSYSRASEIVIRSLPEPLDPNLSDDDFGDFIYAALGEWVVRRGKSKRNLNRSLELLRELTMRFTMEMSMRPFINAFPDPVFQRLEFWAEDENYHVRRLVSESTRPRLPWGTNISTDPRRPLPLLDALHADTTRFVTRSVANHLNDLTRSESDDVLNMLKQWTSDQKQTAKELQWMSRHALRGLVKAGDPRAMRVLGYRPNPDVTMSPIRLGTNKVPFDGVLEFEFDITAMRKESLIVDYVVDFAQPAGRQRKKVHKLKVLHLDRGESRTIHKSHRFRANATTYRLHPGAHRITVQINGRAFKSIVFELVHD